jgi:S-DNA-T family DNA segregation ATPase FtsK/SpoIIIE
VAARRAAAATGRRPLLLLLVDGVEAVTAVLDEGDPGRGSANLLRLLRDGAGAGLTCVVTTDRAVPGGRLAASARHRLVLPLPDRADYAVAGLPARAVPAHRPPGRALLGEEALECQLAAPRPPAPRTARGHPLAPPLRIVELPADPVLDDAPGATRVPDGRSLRLPVGPGGDEGTLLVVDLLRTGGLLVSGPPGSGRSTALDAFARHASELGAAVLRIGRRGAGSDDDPVEDATAWLEPTDEAGMSDWLASRAGRPGVVVADDVGSPAEAPVLGLLPVPGSSSGMVLIAAGGPGSFSAHYQGPVAALRRARSGLLLCPGPGDADLLGIRLPRTPVPVRPGSGWLVTGSALQRVQVARRRAGPPHRTAPLELGVAEGPAGRRRQRRSSTGPISWRAYQASS